MSVLKKITKGYNSISLIVRIALGIVIGVILINQGKLSQFRDEAGETAAADV